MLPMFFQASLDICLHILKLQHYDPLIRAEEVARQFELSGAKFVVTLAMFLPNVKQVKIWVW